MKVKVNLIVLEHTNNPNLFASLSALSRCAFFILLCYRHAENLKQLDNGVKIPPCGWKCSQCDLKDNLWMNLTDGTILCGRKYFDGSGGNNHALEHYKKTGFPLAVKLGTITPSGAGECVSEGECCWGGVT